MSAVFNKTFRDSRRSVLWLSIGMALYTLLILSYYPTLIEQEEEIAQIMESYQDGGFAAMMGGLTDTNLTNPGVFVQLYITTWLLLIVAGIIINQIFNVMTNAERDGTLDVLMSLPVSRRDMLLARMANTTVSILLVLTAVFITLAFSTLVWTDFDPDIFKLALGIYAAFFVLLVFANFTYMLTALIPSSKRFAGPIVYLFLMGSYLLHGFATSVNELEDVTRLFVFEYYQASEIINQGPDFMNMLVLVILSLIFGGIAWWRIDHKELGI